MTIVPRTVPYATSLYTNPINFLELNKVAVGVFDEERINRLGGMLRWFAHWDRSKADDALVMLVDVLFGCAVQREAEPAAGDCSVRVLHEAEMSFNGGEDACFGCAED